MNRFFVNSKQVFDSYIIIDNKSDINHLTKVLRLRVGDEISVSDKERWEYLCKIEEVEKEEVRVKILDKQCFAREPVTRITLFQGIPKAQKMDLIVQKSVELGVAEIIPVFMDRTVVEDKGKFSKKIERWQKLSDEAVKQCKRGIIPSVEDPIYSTNWKSNFKDYDLIIVPYENEENRSIKDLLVNLDENYKNIAVVIGPEGGFSQREIDELIEVGGQVVTLGKTILRTETAGIATIAMTMYQLEL